MGLVRSALRATITGSSGIATPEKWLVDWFGGGPETAAGVRVDESTALTWGPFFAGVRVLSEDVSTLPLILYERLTPRGKRRADTHPVYGLLHDSPNPLQTAVTLRETLQGHVLTWGNAYAYVVRDGRGQVTELWPLRPDRVCPEIEYTGSGRFSVRYLYSDEGLGIQRILLPDEVLHIAGLGYDGVRGYSVICMARNAIGLGLATELYGSAFFANGSRPSGVLTHPDVVSTDARKRMRADWENLHKGLDRAQRMAILEEGVTWQAIGIPNDDAQFVETRKLQVGEAARWLRLPPHKIGDLEHATFSNIEHQGIEYVTSSLRPWLVRWEQAIRLRILNDLERPRLFAEHLVDGLLRGDTTSRFQAYATARQWGWLSANDVRELENQNPVDGGDQYLVPLNMIPADQVGIQPPAAEPSVPGPAAEDEGEEPQDDEDQDDDQAEPAQQAAAAPAARRRSVEARRRIGAAFFPLIEDADRRIAGLERAEVGKLIRAHLGDRARTRSVSAFMAAVAELFSDVIRQRMLERWRPIIEALAAEVIVDAAEEVGLDELPDLAAFIASYVNVHVGYQVASSLGQLDAVTRDTEDPAAAALERLDKWVDERPERTARWQATQVPNAVARETWKEAGLRRVRWTIRGETCPFCVALDGKEVGIDEPFVSKAATTGLGKIMKIEREVYHPPLHQACDCALEFVTG